MTCVIDFAQKICIYFQKGLGPKYGKIDQQNLVARNGLNIKSKNI